MMMTLRRSLFALLLVSCLLYLAHQNDALGDGANNGAAAAQKPAKNKAKADQKKDSNNANRPDASKKPAEKRANKAKPKPDANQPAKKPQAKGKPDKKQETGKQRKPEAKQAKPAGKKHSAPQQPSDREKPKQAAKQEEKPADQARTATKQEPQPAPEQKAVTRPVSFMRDIAPILVSRCVACHNPQKPEGDVLLHNWQAIQQGSGGEPLVEPGEPELSLLVEVLQPDYEPRMPYKEEPLPAQQRHLFEAWVKQGAKFDGPSTTASFQVLLAAAALYRTPPQVYPAPAPVTALAFSPDGKQLATGGYHEILIWDVASGKLVRRIQGAPERVYRLCYSPNGWWLASAGGTPGQAGCVQLWDARTGEPIRELVRTEDAVYGLAFSSDSRYLAAGGCDQTVRLWDLARMGFLKHTFSDHADWVLSVAFSPDGRFLVSASRDKTCKVYDLTKGELLGTFPGHTEAVYAALFTSDGKAVVSAGEDKVLRVWTVAAQPKQQRTIGGHSATVWMLHRLPNGQVASCSADRRVRIVNPANGQQVAAFTGHKEWVYAVAASPDGKLIASGAYDGEVRIWDVAAKKLVRAFVAVPTNENIKDVPVTKVDAVLATLE